MAESESGISDLMEGMDLEVEIIDGFYHQNIGFMNDKVQLFAEYWMKLYLNCCRQGDYAVDLINDENPDEAKAALEDWPDTFGAPNIPQLLFETDVEPKRKKRSVAERECDGVVLIKEMVDNYINGERVYFDVPNVLPESDISLAEYETRIKECENCFKTVEN